MNEQGDYILPIYFFFICEGMCVSFVNQEKNMDHHKERERDTCFCLSD